MRRCDVLAAGRETDIEDGKVAVLVKQRHRVAVAAGPRGGRQRVNEERVEVLGSLVDVGQRQRRVVNDIVGVVVVVVVRVVVVVVVIVVVVVAASDSGV